MSSESFMAFLRRIPKRWIMESISLPSCPGSRVLDMVLPVKGLYPGRARTRSQLAVSQAFSLGEKGIRRALPVVPEVVWICHALNLPPSPDSSAASQLPSSSLVSTGN